MTRVAFGLPSRTRYQEPFFFAACTEPRVRQIAKIPARIVPAAFRVWTFPLNNETGVPVDRFFRHGAHNQVLHWVMLYVINLDLFI